MIKFERFLRSLHSWLGIFVLPWIFVIGLTGIYLNHSKAIYSMLPNAAYDETQMDTWPNATPVSIDRVRELGYSIWPDEIFADSVKGTYHGRPVYVIKKHSGRILIALATGHYWVKTNFTRKTYDPNGKRLNTKYYWGRIFKRVHARGWIDNTFGSWLADITAGAMAVFALSGFVLFLNPRRRKYQNKRQRLQRARTESKI